MGKASFVELQCPHCRHRNNVRCTELEDALAMVATFRKLLMRSPIAFFELDNTGSISAWNPRAASTFNVPQSKALGQSLDKVVAHKHGQRFSQILSQKQRPGQAEPWHGSVRLGPISNSSGSDIETLFNVATFCNLVDGRTMGAICLATLDAASRTALPPQLAALQHGDALFMNQGQWQQPLR